MESTVLIDVQSIENYVSLINRVIPKLANKIIKGNLYPKELIDVDFSSGKQTEQAFKEYENEILILRQTLIDTMFSEGAFSFENYILNEENSPLKYTYISQAMSMVDDLYLNLGNNISGNLSTILKQCTYDLHLEPKEWQSIYKPSSLSLRIDKLVTSFESFINNCFFENKQEKELMLKNKDVIFKYTKDNRELFEELKENNNESYEKLLNLILAHESRINNFYRYSVMDDDMLFILNDSNKSVCFEFLNRFFTDIKKEMDK